MGIKKYLPFYKRNLALAAPIMITQAGQMIVQIIDNLMVAKLGTAEFAGVAFANSIILIGIVFSTCFTQGLIPHAGMSWGRGNYREVSLFFQNALVLDLIVALIIPLVMFCVMPFMAYMGQDVDILVYAKAYYVPAVISFVPYILFFAIRNFSEGIGITKMAMYITIGCNLVNILLNWILIYGNWGFEAMGVVGAAVATLISRVLMVVAFAVVITSVNPYKRYLKFFKVKLVQRSILAKLFKTSMPIGLQGLAEVTAFSLASIIVGFFGKQALAAQQVVYTFDSFIFMLAQGIAVAATIRVAHQYGDGKYRDAKIASDAAMHLSLFVMGGLGLIVVLLRVQISRLFSADAEVVELASLLFLFSFGYKLFDATQLVGAATLRAVGDVKKPLAIAMLSYYVLCVPLGYLCSHVLGWGPQGVYVGLAAGLLLASILYKIRFDRLISALISREERN